MSSNEVTYARVDGDAVADRFLSLRRELGIESFGINLIVLEPRMVMRVHRHREQEEVYLVWSGELTLRTEDGSRVLQRGEIARVPPAVRRQLINAGSSRLELLALGGAGSHSARDGEAFDSWESSEPKEPRDVPLPDDLPS